MSDWKQGAFAVEHARAKLNLALHVRARRPDGYHEIETLFAFVGTADTLIVQRADAPAFEVIGPWAEALAGEGDNLVTRAAALFAARFGGGPWKIRLEKYLPVAAGIGGGSADAAATLRALATLGGIAHDDPGLFEIAGALGSDVPACLSGKTAIGRGRGELLEPAPGMPGKPVLLVNPRVPVPTAEVFARWDGVDRGPLDPDPLRSRNDLEDAARHVAPVIGEVLAQLARQPGAGLVRMSGSGATCFARFDTPEASMLAAMAIHEAHPDWWVMSTSLQ